MSLPGVGVGVLGETPGVGEGCLHRAGVRMEFRASCPLLCSQAHSAPSPGCSCDPRGTLGGVAECQPVSLRTQVLGAVGAARRDPPLPGPTFSLGPQGNGQCFCKPHVCGQTCAACKDGFFGLDQADYFGCRGKRPLTRPSDHILGDAEAQRGTEGAGTQPGPGHGMALAELLLDARPDPCWAWE